MAERTDILRAGEYFLAVQELAMVRSCVSHPSAARQRVDEIRSILDYFEDVPNSLLLPVTEYDVSGLFPLGAHLRRP